MKLSLHAISLAALLPPAGSSALRSRQADGAVSSSTFRRRAYHGSTVLDGWVYIDGGEFATASSDGIKYQYSSTLLAIDLSTSFSTDSVTIHSSSKPRGAPDLRFGSIWTDEANKMFYTGFAGCPSTFGDAAYYPVGLWSFAADGKGSGTWTNLNKTADKAFTTQRRPFAGLSASGNGKGYYLGGLMGNNSVEINAQVGLPGLLTYDYASKTLTNTSVVGISTDGINQKGGLLYVPNFGPKGIVISIGGNQFGKGRKDADNLLSMDTVQILDTDTGKWYEQTVGGIIPERRKEFCIAGAASSNRTYEILLFAGWDGRLGDVSVQYDQAYVLSLPSFQWFKADYKALHPRHGLTCHHVGGGQVLTIGGVDTSQSGPKSLYNDVFNTEDPFPQGLNVFDLNKMAFRKNYESQPGSYAMNVDIQSWYNNHVRKPVFDNNGLDKVFQTENFDNNVPGSPPGDGGGSNNSSSAPAGAIAGGVVGGLAVLVLAGVAICFIIRRKKRPNTSAAGTTGGAAHPNAGYYAAEKKEGYPYATTPLSQEMDTSQRPQEVEGDITVAHELPAEYHYVEGGHEQRQGLGGGSSYTPSGAR